jgi:enamine deaminase RidA (YjgF/YER057c/UK114 family)
VKLITDDNARVYVSGTASIDKSGDTVFIDDTCAQIQLTMQVVQAILNEAKMDWSDAVSSLAYFKHRKDFGLFDDYCRGEGIKLPHIKVQADICRDDLLFELELDAIVKC